MPEDLKGEADARHETATFLSLPGACDLRCTWCNSSGTSPFAADDLTQIHRELGALRRQGETAVGFGLLHSEPTTHPELLRVIRSARKMGFRNIILSSSGIKLADRDFAREVVAAGVTEVVVSVAGHSPETSDLLFGARGATRSKLSALENCMEAGASVTAVCMLLRPTLHELPTLVSQLNTMAGSSKGLLSHHAYLMDLVPSLTPQQHQLLWPPYGELAWVWQRVLDVDRHFPLRARDLPLCVVRALPNARLVGVEVEAKDLFAKPSQLCLECELSDRCPGVPKVELERDLESPLLPLVLSEPEAWEPGDLARKLRGVGVLDTLRPEPPSAEETPRWQRQILERLTRLRRAGTGVFGRSLGEIRRSRKEVRVVLGRAPDHLEAILAPLESSPRYFRAGERLTISYGSETPPKNPEDERALTALLHLLDHRSPEPGGRPRLVLLELVPPDRFRAYRAEYFPFVKSLARSRGVSTHWLVLGVATRPKPREGNPFLYDLERADRERLLTRLSELKPTHLLLNERLTDGLWSEVSQTCVGVRTLQYGTGDLYTFLGELGCDIDDGVRLEETVAAPDYERELLNERVLANRPFTHIMAGPECIYHRPLQDNPHFDGLDLSECDNNDGCSFCGRHRGRPLKRAPEEVAFDQVVAMVETAPVGLPREFLVHGAALWLRLDRFFRRLIDAGVPSSSFHFACRLDEITRMEERIEAILPLLRDHGHSIELSNVGLESFSPVENERFNKGVSPELIKEAAQLLHRWELEFPRTLRFWEHGGFGFITFTPWTTKEDLRQGIEGLHWLSKLYPVPALSLCSRVQLLPDRALTELARRDGLLVDSFDDEVFDSGCVTTWDQQELPWRFRDPDIGVIYRFSRRLAGDPDLPTDDPDTQRIVSWLREVGPADTDVTLDLLELLIEHFEERRSCEKTGGGPQLDVLLDDLAHRLAERPSSSHESRAVNRIPPREGLPKELPDWLARLLRISEGALLRVRERHPELLAGLRPEELRAVYIDRGPALMVRLGSDVDETILYFQAKDSAKRCFATGEFLALFHDPTTPLSDPGRRKAAAVLLRFLDRLAVSTRTAR